MGEAGGVPDDVLEVAEMQTIISLVAGGFGVSLVPASVGQVERSGVAFRPIVGPGADDRARARVAPWRGPTGARRVPQGRTGLGARAGGLIGPLTPSRTDSAP